MKQNRSDWDYLWYAFYAFAGLGAEIVLLNLLEPILFGGISSNEYSPVQTIIHWLLTMICWGTIFLLLAAGAKNKLSFNIMISRNPSCKGVVISILLVCSCIALNFLDWGTFKIIGEFHKKGTLLFAFQYIYYLFEVALIFLIVVFGQKFAESITKKRALLPWGGILLCFTWGAVHLLTKGTLSDGLGVMVFALLFGMMYLLLDRNSKYSYLAMAIAFMI